MAAAGSLLRRSRDGPPINDAPTAADSTVSTAIDVAVEIDLAPLVADVETDDADLIYAITTSPANGDLTGSGPVFTYTPDPGIQRTRFIQLPGDRSGRSGQLHASRSDMLVGAVEHDRVDRDHRHSRIRTNLRDPGRCRQRQRQQHPAGIDCPTDCNETYDDGTLVTLTAVADTGSTSRLERRGCSGTGTCRLTMERRRAT